MIATATKPCRYAGLSCVHSKDTNQGANQTNTGLEYIPIWSTNPRR